MSFQQPPPTLGNQYEDDRVLRSYLKRVLPETMLREIEPSLIELGHLAGGELYRMQLADRLNEPKLTEWDSWGNRIDTVEVTPLWCEAERIAVEYGLVATPYEQRHGSLSRVHQCALAYLFTPSTDIYSCPLAMTDGAARTLLNSGNQALIDRAVPHLISRNPEDFWTAGQWMTELTGGSDVGLSETVAKREDDRETGKKGNGEKGNGQTENAALETPNSTLSPQHSELETRNSKLETWHLFGTKWFTSAINSQIALTLARPKGNPAGGRGLALFYLELRDESGRLRNIQINRLKDKLGTRKVPTAELTLVGTPAQLVKGTTDGVRNIAPLLNITRLWNGISAVALMRRGIALATDYARKRIAFGSPLVDKPLHMDTLAGLQAEAEAAFHLAFFVAELTGRAESSNQQSAISSQQSTGSGAVARPSGRAPDGDDRTKGGSDRVSTDVQSPTSNVQSSWDSQLQTPDLSYPDSSYVAKIAEDERLLLRLLTPVMKLTTGKQAVLVLSEVVEAFGGAGYVEDTGLPQLLRDSQVLPIWEGTTNVLSLDTLRALGVGGPKSNVQSPTSQSKGVRGEKGKGETQSSVLSPPNHELETRNPKLETWLSSAPFQALKSAVSNCLSEARDPRIIDAGRIARAALDHAESWLAQARDQTALESGARRFAMTLGRTMELALLIKHAQWSQDHEADGRATAAARRFANSGIDLLVDYDLHDVRELFP